MNDRLLEQIRRRFDEYSYTNSAGYRAFMHESHNDVGALLGEVDRLRAIVAKSETDAGALFRRQSEAINAAFDNLPPLKWDSGRRWDEGRWD